MTRIEGKRTERGNDSKCVRGRTGLKREVTRFNGAEAGNDSIWRAKRGNTGIEGGSGG